MMMVVVSAASQSLRLQTWKYNSLSLSGLLKEYCSKFITIIIIIKTSNRYIQLTYRYTVSK